MNYCGSIGSDTHDRGVSCVLNSPFPVGVLSGPGISAGVTRPEKKIKKSGKILKNCRGRIIYLFWKFIFDQHS